MVTTEPVAAHALRMLAESFVRRRWEQAIAAATHVRLVLSCLVLWMAMAQPLHYTAIERHRRQRRLPTELCACLSACLLVLPPFVF